MLSLALSATFSTPEDTKTMTICAYLLRNICHQRHFFRPGEFGTFEKRAPGLNISGSLRCSWINRRGGR